jgi:hypothetical protein
VVLTPQQLEVTAQSLTAVLAVWLGLTVLTRSAAPPARVFSFLALALVAWSSSVIVQRLSTSCSACRPRYRRSRSPMPSRNSRLR